MTGFPGGTAVSQVRVYDWPTADDQAGGSPHLHTASTEGYVVLTGHGAVETLSSDGFRSTPLSPGTLLWFTPGTVHRLINTSGDLEILVVMQNAGLPEAGDAVFTYPPHVLADPREYARITTLPSGADVTEEQLADAARRRRDLAITGYLALKRAVADDGPTALAPLYRAAAALVQDKTADWRRLWQQRPLSQAQETGTHIDKLASGQADHLALARLRQGEVLAGPRRFGMCGRLQVWDLEGG